MRFVPFFLSGDETQCKANGSVSQQDIYGNKISKEHKISKFTGNDSWPFVLGKIWEELSIEDQYTYQSRHPRWVALRESSISGGNLSMSWSLKSKQSTRKPRSILFIHRDFHEDFFKFDIHVVLETVENNQQERSCLRNTCFCNGCSWAPFHGIEFIPL